MDIKRKDDSRRAFLKRSSLGGLGVLLGANIQPSLIANAKDEPDARTLSVRPRYYRWHVDPGVEWLETNTDYANLSWDIPVAQACCALNR